MNDSTALQCALRQLECNPLDPQTILCAPICKYIKAIIDSDTNQNTCIGIDNYKEDQEQTSAKKAGDQGAMTQSKMSAKKNYHKVFKDREESGDSCAPRNLDHEIREQNAETAAKGVAINITSTNRIGMKNVNNAVISVIDLEMQRFRIGFH